MFAKRCQKTHQKVTEGGGLVLHLIYRFSNKKVLGGL